MDISKALGIDPGKYLKEEVEEAISPVTDRVATLEKKLDLLILTAQRIEASLKKIEPVVGFISKLPFVNKG